MMMQWQLLLPPTLIDTKNARPRTKLATLQCFLRRSSTGQYPIHQCLVLCEVNQTLRVARRNLRERFWLSREAWRSVPSPPETVTSAPDPPQQVLSK